MTGLQKNQGREQINRPLNAKLGSPVTWTVWVTDRQSGK